jgi:hypothetical protein
VDNGRLLGASHGVVAPPPLSGGRSAAAVAEGRTSRLLQGRSDEPFAWGSWAARGSVFPVAMHGADLFPA